MIDYIKLNKYLTRVEVQQLKKNIDFYSTFNTATGEEVSMSSNGKRVLTHLLGWEKNMKIKLYPNGWIDVSGSLHKLFNDGKHNFNFKNSSFYDLMFYFKMIVSHFRKRSFIP